MPLPFFTEPNKFFPVRKKREKYMVKLKTVDEVT